MPMPDLGDMKQIYGRFYTWINPDASLGPPTWRLSNPEMGDPNQPGGGGGVANIESTAPITDNTINDVTTIGFDISELPDIPTVRSATADDDEDEERQINVVVPDSYN